MGVYPKRPRAFVALAAIGLVLGLAKQAYLLETGRVVVKGTSDAISRDETVRRAYLGY